MVTTIDANPNANVWWIPLMLTLDASVWWLWLTLDAIVWWLPLMLVCGDYPWCQCVVTTLDTCVCLFLCLCLCLNLPPWRKRGIKYSRSASIFIWFFLLVYCYKRRSWLRSQLKVQCHTASCVSRYFCRHHHLHCQDKFHHHGNHDTWLVTYVTHVTHMTWRDTRNLTKGRQVRSPWKEH